ncbi:hypothetical protein ACQP0C_37200 [Nocardia sp. CA-129566]|uniref:hypothetical protein n=1 Tax=Nocardia sp. CA-129566 TaxID=3239976 RepID=UPI003D95809C
MAHNKAPTGVPTSIALECYGPAQVAGNAATAYLSLAMPNKVEQYVELALPEMSSADSPWGRSLVMIDLARSQILSAEADLDYAAAIMIDALNISAGKPMVSLQQRAAEFVHQAIDRWGNLSQLHAIHDALEDLAGR